jgi:ABC-type glycerol-3-phosphate transport system permease component
VSDAVTALRGGQSRSSSSSGPSGSSGSSGLARGIPAGPVARARSRLRPGRVLAFLLATGWLVIVIAPIYYMVLASFRSQGSYLTANPWLPGGGLSLSEYGTVLAAGLGRYLVNSVIITAVCIALTLSTCLAAAFRIVRRSTYAAGASFYILLLGLAIPIQAIIVPL